MSFLSRLTICFVTCGLLTPATANAQFQFAAPGNQTAMFEQIVQRQVDQEINCMRMVTDVPEEAVDAILEATSPLVTERAEEVVEAISAGNPSATTGLGGLSKPMKDAIIKAAEKELPAKSFKAYAKDATQRNSFQRKAAQRGYLVAMDDLLSLSSKQYAAVAKLVMKSWKDEWNAIGMMIGSTPSGLLLIKDQIKALPEAEMKEILRESQWEALNGMLELEMIAFAQPGPVTELQGTAMNLLRIEELQELCNLDVSQTEKFNEAAETALKSIVKKKAEAMQAMQGGDMQAIMKHSQVIAQPVSAMMDEADEWKTAIDSILNADQAKLFEKRMAFRTKQSKNALYAATVMMMDQQAGGVTSEQQLKLAKMLPKHLKLGTNMMGGMQELAKIPEKELKEILSDEQFSKIDAMMKALAQQAEGQWDANGDITVEAAPAVAE